MTKEDAIKYLQQLYPNGGHCWLDEQRIEAISMAIDALQEVPAPKILEDMLNAKTAAESLGISPEEYDKIVDKCLYGKEPVPPRFKYLDVLKRTHDEMMERLKKNNDNEENHV